MNSRCLLLACAVLVAAAAADVPAQPADPALPAGPAAVAAAAAPADAGHAAPLVVFNRRIIAFRAPLLGYGAAERESMARERVRALLQRGGPADVALQTLPQGVAVTIDGGLAFLVTPGDADGLAGESAAEAAARAAEALRHAIAETHELRDPRAMGRAAGLALAFTLLWTVLLWGLARLGRSLGARLLHVAEARARRLKVGDVQLFEHERTLSFLRRLVTAAFWFLGLLVTYGWIGRVLQLFPFTRPWGERLDDFLVGLGAFLFGGIAGAVPGLLIAVAIFLVARFAVGLLQRFFDRVQTGRLALGWLDADTARPTRRLVTAAIWLLALAMAYPHLPGASTNAFKGLSVLIGLMVSIGGASVVGQALSGLILMYSRSFRIGDYVRVGEHEGTVVELGLYQTRVRTGLGDELVLPNALVLGAVTTNYSRGAAGGGFLLDAKVGIGYGTPWRQVHALLEEAARRTPGVAELPPPRVYQTALADFYVEYRLVAQAAQGEPAARAQAQSLLHQHILDVFNEHEVQMLSPHYLGDPDEPKLVPPSRWFEPPARPPQGTQLPAASGPARAG
jgi:small-conductance mechanosensitive channel